MTARASTAKGLHAKLAEVMAGAERIPKNGTAPQAMGGFRFVQVGDAADAIRKSLGERGVSMLPSGIELVSEAEHQTSGGKAMTTMTVRTTWTLVDGETGETATIQSLGAGADTGDKAAPKAQSNAMKYALLMGFLLSTGDDPEQTDTSDRQARQVMQRPATSPSRGGAAAPSTDGAWGGAVSFGSPPVDGSLRTDAELGEVCGFKLTEPVSGARPVQVVAIGELAGGLAAALGAGVPEQAKVWGRLVMVPWEKDGRQMPPYRRIVAERIETPEWKVPAATPAPTAAQAALDAELDALPW